MTGPLTKAATNDLVQAFRDTVTPRRVPVVGTVQGVERNSNGMATSMTVRIGDVDYPSVPLSGYGARVGDTVRLSRSIGASASPDWRFEGYEDSIAPFPVLDDDVTIPAPTWGSPALSTGIIAPSPGGQYATITVKVRETPEKFGPERTEIQWATNADAALGNWSSTMIGNVGGQDADITTVLQPFPANTQINVRARTYTNSGARSPFGDAQTITTASDTTTPGAPGVFTVDTTKSLTAVITLPAPSQPLVFSYWEVSIATSSGGAGATSYFAYTNQWTHTVGSPTSIYIRIREVTRSGVASAWNPSGSWAGPYNLIATDAYVDLTAPAVPSIASVTEAREIIQGVMGVTVTTTLNSYSPPSDFLYFEYRYFDGTSYEFFQSTQTTHKRFNARQGVTYSVQVRAADVNDNISAYSSSSSVLTPTISAPPTPGSAPTVTPVYRGNVITWAATPSNATNGEIVSYEVQFSTDNSSWSTIANVDATRWVDASRGAGVLCYYRYRPINSAGTSAAGFSPSASGTTLLVETGTIAANAVEANTIAANAVTTAKIAAGAITADKIAATVILASQEISAGATGKFTAGGSRVTLDANGIRVLHNNDDEQWIRLAPITGPAGWTGSIGTSMGTYSNGLGAMIFRSYQTIPGFWAATGFVFFGQGVENPSNWRLMMSSVSGRSGTLRFYDNSDTAGWEYGWAGIRRNDSTIGTTYTPGYFTLQGWNTSAANTPVSKTLSSMNIPAGATGVVVRYTFTAAVGIHVYLHQDSAQIDSGLYSAGTGGSVTMDGIVGVGAGDQIYLQSTGGTVTGTLVVTGYFR